MRHGRHDETENEDRRPHQREIEQKQRIIVGVNDFKTVNELPPDLLKVNPAIEEKQRARLAKVRGERDHVGFAPAEAPRGRVHLDQDLRLLQAHRPRGALGGGVELALTCDMILAADTAYLGQVEVAVGLHPLLGGTQRLVRLVGRARALPLLYEARRLSAKEAEAVVAEIRKAIEEPLSAIIDAVKVTLDKTPPELAGDYRLILITKGDLFDQERKLAQSGLGDYFDAVEIVSEKTARTYERIFARHADGPERAGAPEGHFASSASVPFVSSSRSRASVKTASWFPASAVSVNTSAMT